MGVAIPTCSERFVAYAGIRPVRYNGIKKFYGIVIIRRIIIYYLLSDTSDGVSISRERASHPHITQ